MDITNNLLEIEIRINIRLNKKRMIDQIRRERHGMIEIYKN